MGKRWLGERAHPDSDAVGVALPVATNLDGGGGFHLGWDVQRQVEDAGVAGGHRRERELWQGHAMALDDDAGRDPASDRRREDVGDRDFGVEGRRVRARLFGGQLRGPGLSLGAGGERGGRGVGGWTALRRAGGDGAAGPGEARKALGRDAFTSRRVTAQRDGEGRERAGSSSLPPRAAQS